MSKEILHEHETADDLDPNRFGTKGISGQRRTTYYIGVWLMVAGFVLFSSIFGTFARHFGDFSNFGSEAKSNMFRAMGGMALPIVGNRMRSVGVRGLAGSGSFWTWAGEAGPPALQSHGRRHVEGCARRGRREPQEPSREGRHDPVSKLRQAERRGLEVLQECGKGI
ncbi:MAG: hypothetical protein ABIP94_09475 [Planctomycetota bacterium]